MFAVSSGTGLYATRLDALAKEPPQRSTMRGHADQHLFQSKMRRGTATVHPIHEVTCEEAKAQVRSPALSQAEEMNTQRPG